MVPIVTGLLGSVYIGDTQYLNSTSKTTKFNVIQKTALLGTANIIHNVIGKNNRNIGQWLYILDKSVYQILTSEF